MRLIGPLLVGVLYGQAECVALGQSCGITEGNFLQGVFIGGVLASAFDAILLGRKKVKVDPSYDDWE